MNAVDPFANPPRTFRAPEPRVYTWAEEEAISAAGEQYQARDLDEDALDRAVEDRAAQVWG